MMAGDALNSLHDWQEMFGQIYGEVNDLNPLKPSEYWLYIIEKVGQISRDIRKRKYSLLGHRLAHLFAWLCSFCNERGISLSDAVWYRYPTVCPFCVKKPCECQQPSHKM